MSQADEASCRYCLEYGKSGRARLLSHLDLQAAMERALRRARLPLAFSQGFQPRPRLQYEDALPLGWGSERERMWLDLRRPFPAHEAARRVARTLPEGLELRALYPAPGRPRPLVRRRYRVSGFALAATDAAAALAPSSAGADPDAGPAVEARADGEAVLLELRAGVDGSFLSLRKLLRRVADDDEIAGLEVLRLAVVEDRA